MYFYKKINENNKGTDTPCETDDITMANLAFLKYWLYAAFPHCYYLWRYLLERFPDIYGMCSKLQWGSKRQENAPAYRTVNIVSEDGAMITILLYKYHVEYRTEGREVYQPYLSYHMVENLDNDTFFLLLPIVDVMIDYEYTSENIIKDLSRRFLETALPKESIEEVSYGIKLGLIDADGAEDEPSWTIWQETEDSLYGAMWWADAGEIELFQRCNPGEKGAPGIYIDVPEGKDGYLLGKYALSKWISQLH